MDEQLESAEQKVSEALKLTSPAEDEFDLEGARALLLEAQEVLRKTVGRRAMSDWSLRERDVKMRSWGEAGWKYGWKPFDLRDQFAHLGELVSDIADYERLPELRRELEATGMDLEMLRERVARDAYELGRLVVLAVGEVATREQCLQVEAEYNKLLQEKQPSTE